jgi:hypothetical protein
MQIESAAGFQLWLLTHCLPYIFLDMCLWRPYSSGIVAEGDKRQRRQLKVQAAADLLAAFLCPKF